MSSTFGWDLPPGCSSLPGDNDVDLSYSAEIIIESERDDIQSYNAIISEGVSFITPNNVIFKDRHFILNLTIYGDITVDRYYDDDEIESLIMEDISDTFPDGFELCEWAIIR